VRLITEHKNLNGSPCQATEEGPPDASGDAVLDAGRIFTDDLAPVVCGLP
jgi:hypothetical protein